MRLLLLKVTIIKARLKQLAFLLPVMGQVFIQCSNQNKFN